MWKSIVTISESYTKKKICVQLFTSQKRVGAKPPFYLLFFTPKWFCTWLIRLMRIIFLRDFLFLFILFYFGTSFWKYVPPPSKDIFNILGNHFLRLIDGLSKLVCQKIDTLLLCISKLIIIYSKKNHYYIRST